MKPYPQGPPRCQTQASQGRGVEQARLAASRRPLSGFRLLRPQVGRPRCQDARHGRALRLSAAHNTDEPSLPNSHSLLSRALGAACTHLEGSSRGGVPGLPPGLGLPGSSWVLGRKECEWPVAVAEDYRGPVPQQKARNRTRCGMEKPLGHRQSPEGKGKEKEVAGALPLSLSSRLSLPQSSSLQSEFSGNEITEHD